MPTTSRSKHELACIPRVTIGEKMELSTCLHRFTHILHQSIEPQRSPQGSTLAAHRLAISLTSDVERDK